MIFVTRRSQSQLLRFFLIGISSVIVDLTIYKTVLLLLFPVPFAKAIGFFCGTLLSYQANRVWTFDAGHAGPGQFLRFYSIYGISLSLNVSINTLTISALSEGFGLATQIAFLIATFISAIFNFVGMKCFVFKSCNK